jgi:hypothetical protein
MQNQGYSGQQQQQATLPTELEFSLDSIHLDFCPNGVPPRFDDRGLSCLSAKKRWWETTGYCVRLDSVCPFFLSYTIIHNHLIYQYTLVYGMEYIYSHRRQ